MKEFETRRLQVNLGKSENKWVDLKKGFLSVHCGATTCLQNPLLECFDCICANNKGIGEYTHSLENLRKLKRVRDLNENIANLKKARAK